jgi:putative phage-type endonuclease
MIEQRSAQWHEQRAGKLTGSMFSAALGLNPYCSRQKLWRLLTGRQQPDAENAAMAHGTASEPIAIGLYEEQTGNIVRPAPFVQYKTWGGVSPDGLVSDAGCIEVKSPTQKIHDEIPSHYLPQCVGVLHVCKRDWIDFVSFFDGQIAVYRITAEETAQQWAEWEKELEDFYNSFILADVEPPRKTRSKK